MIYISKIRTIGLLVTLISFLANHIVQTYKIQMFPEIYKEEQVIEQGSTLKLTCITDLDDKYNVMLWTVPPITHNKEVNK